MFKSLDSIASVVGIFMYLTISKFKQVLRSRKGLGKTSTTTLVVSVVSVGFSTNWNVEMLVATPMTLFIQLS